MNTAADKTPLVGYFKSCKMTKGGINRPLGAILSEIQSDVWAAKTAILRSHVYKSAKYDSLKRTLPAVMFAGSTRGGHKKVDVLRHSGLLAVDVDDLETGAAVSIRDHLGNDLHILASWISPSARGVKALCRIPADVATHKLAFVAAQSYFRERHGIQIDPACSDVCRLCFISHDPDLRTNEDAIELQIQDYNGKNQTTSLESLSDTERRSDGVDRDTDAIEVCVESVEEAVEIALPSRIHRNNDKLFILARAVKTLELRSGKFTEQGLRGVFDEWFTRSADFLRPGQTKDEYLIEFLNAYASARTPLGADVISKAWKLAQENPLPPEAVEKFEDEEKRLAVALCRELQILAGEQPFFLSCRTLARLLNHDGHAKAARWLRAFCVLKILKESEKGKRDRASRYHYGFPL